MSDVVGGGVSRGKGNTQVTMGFIGKCTEAEWAEFVQCVVRCARQAGIRVTGVGRKRTGAGATRKTAKKKAKKKAAKK
jgi:hypothetical protein